MNTRAQLWCAWAIVPFILIYLIGFIGLAGFVPPTAPSMTSGQLVEFYNANRTGIRGGQLICLVVSPLFLCWAAAISAQMARVEKGTLPMLALLQFGAALILTVFFMLCSLIWSVAAYREDMSPELLRLVHDTGWLFFVMAYPEYLVQLGCIAVIGFMDNSAQPLLPRWLCYFTIWTETVGIGGGFSTFVKSGPFAWNGLFGFWIPVAFFLIWLLVTLPYFLAAIRRQMLERGSG
jgi:hypothetical protein